MTQPVTELDARFSDPAAVAADWGQTRRTLEDAELFWIATVRADGRRARRRGRGRGLQVIDDSVLERLAEAWEAK